MSYSFIVLIETLAAIGFFSFFLFVPKRPESLFRGKNFVRISVLFFAASIILFLVPKIILLNEYSYTKLSGDAWQHYAVLDVSSNTNHLSDDIYPYYSKFPITYATELVLAKTTGLPSFDSMAIYYLVAGIFGLLIIYGLSRNLIRGSQADRIIFTGLVAVIYSVVQYFNLVVVQQYPLAIGTISALLCVYSFSLISTKKKKSLILLCLAGSLLVVSHPFAPILTSILFVTYFLIDKFTFKKGPYNFLVARRISIFMALIIVIAGATYSVYAVPELSGPGLGWFKENVQFSLNTLMSNFLSATERGVESSFEDRYQGIETAIYALNWALPAASSISMLIYALSKRLKIEEDAKQLLVPLALVSAFLFGLTFAFSLTEFAFSRYFGTFALAFNIPLYAYVIFRVLKARIIFAKYIGIAVLLLTVITSVTDPTIIPKTGMPEPFARNYSMYASQHDIIALDNFFLIGDPHKTVITNIFEAPVEPFMEIHQFKNTLVNKNPTEDSIAGGNSFLILDKTSSNMTEKLDASPRANIVYDNSAVLLAN